MTWGNMLLLLLHYYSRSKPRTTTRFPLFFSSFFPSLFSSSSTAVDCIHFPSLQLPLWLPHHGQCPRFLDVRPTSGSSTQPLSFFFFPTTNQKGRKDTGLITIRSGFLTAEPPKDTEENSTMFVQQYRTIYALPHGVILVEWMLWLEVQKYFLDLARIDLGSPRMLPKRSSNKLINCAALKKLTCCLFRHFSSCDLVAFWELGDKVTWSSFLDGKAIKLQSKARGVFWHHGNVDQESCSFNSASSLSICLDGHWKKKFHNVGNGGTVDHIGRGAFSVPLALYTKRRIYWRVVHYSCFLLQQ